MNNIPYISLDSNTTSNTITDGVLVPLNELVRCQITDPSPRQLYDYSLNQKLLYYKHRFLTSPFFSTAEDVELALAHCLISLHPEMDGDRPIWYYTILSPALVEHDLSLKYPELPMQSHKPTAFVTCDKYFIPVGKGHFAITPWFKSEETLLQAIELRQVRYRIAPPLYSCGRTHVYIQPTRLFFNEQYYFLCEPICKKLNPKVNIVSPFMSEARESDISGINVGKGKKRKKKKTKQQLTPPLDYNVLIPTRHQRKLEYNNACKAMRPPDVRLIKLKAQVMGELLCLTRRVQDIKVARLGTHVTLHRSIEDQLCTSLYDIHEKIRNLPDFKSESRDWELVEQVGLFAGTNLVSFTYTNPARLCTYRSESMKVPDYINHLSKNVSSLTHDTSESALELINLLREYSTRTIVNFDPVYVADILSQLYISTQLLRVSPTICNIIAVCINMFSKIPDIESILSNVTMFIKDAVDLMVSSVMSFGYRSEAASSRVSYLMSSLANGVDVMNDELIDVVLAFIAKITGLFAIITAHLSIDKFSVSSLPEMVGVLRESIRDGADIVTLLFKGYNHIISNFPQFIDGDFSSILFGKSQAREFESRVARILALSPLANSGNIDILRKEHGLSICEYDTQLQELISTGERLMKVCQPAQRPSLKTILCDLHCISVDRSLAHAKVQTKISAYGVCFVGESCVGKSFLMREMSNSLIVAYGEDPTPDKIITGQLSDKFDSNEQPHHLVFQYDDVANNKNSRESFDKLLNAINSQARPLLKSAVEEKGKMYPGNIACVISSNVPGLGAEQSNCPDSIARRFIHIRVQIKPILKAEICVPGTARIDPVKCGRNRFDIWQFDVLEFVSFTPPDSMDGIELWGPMYVRPVKWTDKPLDLQTFDDLRRFLASRARDHYIAQREIISQLDKGSQKYCIECCIPESTCECMRSEVLEKPENTSYDIDATADALISLRALTSLPDRSTIIKGIKIAYAFAPCDCVRALGVSLCMGIICAYFLGRTYFEIGSVVILVTFTHLLLLILCSYLVIYNRLSRVADGLSRFATDSQQLVHEYKYKMFSGSAVIVLCYGLYRLMRPKSQAMSYREQLPEVVRDSFARYEKAKTTPVDRILPHIEKDLAIITVWHNGKKFDCLAFPVESNIYATVGHILPVDCEFDLMLTHDGITSTAARQRIGPQHIYRVKDRDLALFQVPSAVPRRGYKDFFLARNSDIGSQAINLVVKDLDTRVVSRYPTRMSKGWGLFSTVTTDLVTLHKPYSYQCPIPSYVGLCGAVVMDFSKSIIYGFHVAGNGKYGLCSMLTHEDISSALSFFSPNFVPLNKGDIQMASHVLRSEAGLCAATGCVEAYNCDISDRNCITEGVIDSGGVKFTPQHIPHPFLPAIVKQFGPPQFAPPYKPNNIEHKLKALKRLANPQHLLPQSLLDRARQDYYAPICDYIREMTPARRIELQRPLTMEEVLDGTIDGALYGIDNSTSVGFPFIGTKRKFLAKVPGDPVQPVIPRELIVVDGVNMLDEVCEMERRYLSGISCRPLFKCAIKTDELLPQGSQKARVFMASNFPLLILCRKYLGPLYRLMYKQGKLFETAKGINMDSIEAEELFNHLNWSKNIIALDYTAFDQSMSAQVTSCVAAIICDILRELGCSDDHLCIVRGILTDIVYPNLHFFGTIIQLANSNPSGQGLTTEVNGMANSLYLRMIFFRLYTEVKCYRDAVHTVTYGDDNDNSVLCEYSLFNGENIVRLGAEFGLVITMADKHSDIVAYTTIWECEFLKRTFRFCPDLGHIRAPLHKTSIEKSIHWIKKKQSDPPEVSFAQLVDGMLRKASQHGREYYDEILSKLLVIATEHNCKAICYWWEYDELIHHDRLLYYDNFRSEARCSADVDTRAYRKDRDLDLPEMRLGKSELSDEARDGLVGLLVLGMFAAAICKPVPPPPGPPRELVGAMFWCVVALVSVIIYQWMFPRYTSQARSHNPRVIIISDEPHIDLQISLMAALADHFEDWHQVVFCTREEYHRMDNSTTITFVLLSSTVFAQIYPDRSELLTYDEVLTRITNPPFVSETKETGHTFTSRSIIFVAPIGVILYPLTTNIVVPLVWLISAMASGLLIVAIADDITTSYHDLVSNRTWCNILLLAILYTIIGLVVATLPIIGVPGMILLFTTLVCPDVFSIRYLEVCTIMSCALLTCNQSPWWVTVISAPLAAISSLTFPVWDEAFRSEMAICEYTDVDKLDAYIVVFGERAIYTLLRSRRQLLYVDAQPGVLSTRYQELNAFIMVFGHNNVLTLLQSELAILCETRTGRTVGSIHDDFREVLLILCLEFSLQNTPSEMETKAQDAALAKYGGTLMAREITLVSPHGPISCDLVVKKGNTYIFIEAKMVGDSATREQALARKTALSALFKQYITQFAYYVSSTGYCGIV